MKFAIIATILAVSLCRFAQARFMPFYSYEELMAMADLVVLMEHESTTETEAADAQGGLGQITSAKVLLVFKGKIEGKNVKIEHFYYGMLPSLPNPIVFPSNKAEGYWIESARRGISVHPTRQYLAFMKLQKNGTYTSVTPNFDSKLSFLPVGGNMNDLWTEFVKYEAAEATGKPLVTRKFVEVPQQ